MDRSGEIALDLYAGVGLFSLALARRFVTSWRLSRHKVRRATSNTILLGTRRRCGRRWTPTSRRTARRCAGAVSWSIRRVRGWEIALRAIAKLGAPRVTYVSCDPATLARDLVALTGDGYRVEQLHLVDLFPQTYHIESVVELVR